jgi:hypothetical protein
MGAQVPATTASISFLSFLSFLPSSPSSLPRLPRLPLLPRYPYNRTCNFFRETQHSPDGNDRGYNGTCDPAHPLPLGNDCPPCPGLRLDGTPPCNIDASKGFSTASVQGWGFISPHGIESKSGVTSDDVAAPGSPQDVTRMVAALLKYACGVGSGAVVLPYTVY